MNKDCNPSHLDQTPNPNNTLVGRSFNSRAPATQAFSPYAANVPDWGSNRLSCNTNFVPADIYVFNSPSVGIAEFRFMHFDGASTAVRESEHVAGLQFSLP
jgi:hypothetical protein